MTGKDSDATTRQAGDDKPVVSLWKGTDYGAWFTADTCASFSGSIQSFALPLVAQAVTGSAALASLLRSVQGFVSAALTIPGGVVEDRVDRRKLLIIWGLSGCLGFALLSVFCAANWLSYALLLALAVLLGVRSGLLGDTSNAMLRGVVPNELLPKAMSLNSGRDSAASLAGAPISGALLSVTPWLPFAAVSALNGLETLAASRITHYWKPGQDCTADGDGSPDAGVRPSTPAVSETTTHRLRRLVAEAFSGLLWMMRDPFQRRMLVSSAVSSAAFSAFLLITILSISQATGNVVSAAFMNSAVAVGTLIGALIASGVVNHIPGGVVVIAYFATLTLGTAGAAFLPWTAARMASLACVMLFLPAGNAIFGGFQSILISKGNLGKVFAGMSVVELVVTPTITALAGFGSQYLGYRPTSGILVGVIVLAALPCLTLRPLLTMPLPDKWEEHIERCGITTF